MKSNNEKPAFDFCVMILVIVMGVLAVFDVFPYCRDCVEGRKTATTEIYYVTDGRLEFNDGNNIVRSFKITDKLTDMLLPEGCAEPNSTVSKWKVSGRLSITYYPYSGVIADYKIDDKRLNE